MAIGGKLKVNERYRDNGVRLLCSDQLNPTASSSTIDDSVYGIGIDYWLNRWPNE